MDFVLSLFPFPLLFWTRSKLALFSSYQLYFKCYLKPVSCPQLGQSGDSHRCSINILGMIFFFLSPSARHCVKALYIHCEVGVPFHR